MAHYLMRAAALILLICAGRAHGADAPLRLAAPAEMAETGFLTHILPRFRFKARIIVDVVAPGADADMALVTGPDGAAVFTGPDGAIHLQPLSPDPRIKRFAEWLRSGPGMAAVNGFPVGGPSLYAAGTRIAVAEVEQVIDGDVALGARLALVHCGRCHVVDKRNRMGGIGSTPSFPALRGRTGWADLFRVYWSENPHPSFTQVAGVTDPFPPGRPAFVAPVTITLGEIDAIVAFVATITPKDLGPPVRGN
ncbi:MAG: mono/diheme cytochrome c family protein [Paracoccaceae bacterium]|jgi:mono/diheme cytochrome c family protein